MATKAIGGGSSAVAASSHAACARFRGTDPLVTGLTRRNLATAVGFADTGGGIPQARWMRAMTFERLVRHESFASKVATTTAGYVGLPRPSEVVIRNAHVNASTTADLLAKAHSDAMDTGSATLLYGLAVPFAGYEESAATDVKPDFAVVAPKASPNTGSWLILGDAKDYERIRSRIDDTRLLKGFLQVAVGAESARVWSKLPSGMHVHTHGVLAVPRNSFLQPEPIVENLHDYREEVVLRIEERRREADSTVYEKGDPLEPFVAHLKASFDPTACTTCTLFGYCRDELRHSNDPADLLIELGVGRDLRKQTLGLVDATHDVGRVPASTAAMIEATLSGRGVFTGQHRVDQLGLPGSVNVVLAKSDAAALGVHGVSIQRITAGGVDEWTTTVFDDPQSPTTRRAVMKAIGKALNLAMRDQRRIDATAPPPVHLVVPDPTSADVLVSIADNLAGIELSRLRWERDRQMGRPALTFDGEPADVPPQMSEVERTAVSFLLEDDRARVLTLRSAVIDARAVLARHVVPGGPATNGGRLDYLVEWAETVNSNEPVDHRAFADQIELAVHTPGAKLTNSMSDEIHVALVGDRRRPSGSGPADPAMYEKLVTAELTYKSGILTRAIAALEPVPDSRLRPVYRAIEADAQAVWRRRLDLHASDLVRFGRTYRTWRNSQVPMIESDLATSGQLLALSNPHAAWDLATAAGTRQVAFATVVSTTPLVLDVDSRRLAEGDRVVLLTVDGENAAVDSPEVTIDRSGKGSVKIDGLSLGPLSRSGLTEDSPRTTFVWTPQTPAKLHVDDQIVIANVVWFTKNIGNRFLNVSKPAQDATSAPKVDCNETSYDDDPETHRWCCRSHEASEAEFSDDIALRRARGQLNPQTWPPVRDSDAFDVSPAGSTVGNPYASAPEPVPGDLTIDDVE